MEGREADVIREIPAADVRSAEVADEAV